jgi:hypothetical protein
MVEKGGAWMLEALADEQVLRAFAQVVVATGTGLPERSDGAISIRYITAHGVSRETGLPVDAIVELDPSKHVTGSGCPSRDTASVSPAARAQCRWSS